MIGYKLFSVRTLLLVIMALPLLLAAPRAWAATIAIDHGCTFHAALNAANKDKPKSNCESGSGDDIIVFTRDAKPRSGTLPKIDDDLVIDGNYHTVTAIGSEPFLRAQGVNLTIKNLTVVFEGQRSGKAMEVKDGRLTLINVVFKQCKKGIRQHRNHTSISGNSDICGLDIKQWVDGGYSADIEPPSPPAQPESCGPLASAGIHILPTYGLGSGAQCRRLHQGQIVDPAALAGGFIDAVDFWGYIEQGVEVCFSQLGAMTFIDATTMPRAVSSLPSYNKNGQACAVINRAGIVLLAPGTPSGGAPPQTTAPEQVTAPADSAQPVQTSTGCAIHTTGHLKLRMSPSLIAAVLDFVPRGSNLSASDRTQFWYEVSYRGQTGWIGGAFVRGSC